MHACMRRVGLRAYPMAHWQRLKEARNCHCGAHGARAGSSGRRTPLRMCMRMPGRAGPARQQASKGCRLQ